MHQPNSLSFFSHRGEEEQGQQGGNPLLGGKLCVQNWGGGAAGRLLHVSLSLGSLKYSLYYIFFLTLMSLIPYDTNVFIT